MTLTFFLNRQPHSDLLSVVLLLTGLWFFPSYLIWYRFIFYNFFLTPSAIWVLEAALYSCWSRVHLAELRQMSAKMSVKTRDVLIISSLNILQKILLQLRVNLLYMSPLIKETESLSARKIYVKRCLFGKKNFYLFWKNILGLSSFSVSEFLMFHFDFSPRFQVAWNTIII